MPSMTPAVAADFDGCIAGYAFPACGEPRENVVTALRCLKVNGWEIIVHSARVNPRWPEPGRTQKVMEMLQYLLVQRIPFARVWGVELLSEHAGEIELLSFAFSTKDVGKPAAHLYLDDRGLVDLDPLTADEIVQIALRRFEETEREHAESLARNGEAPTYATANRT